MSQFERIKFIHETIRKQGFIFKKSIFEEFGISERTLSRDIQFMREEMKVPIVYDIENKIFKYDKPCDLFDFYNEKILMTLVFFEKVINYSYYIPCFSENIRREILKKFPKKWSKLCNNFIFYENVEIENINLEYLNKIVSSFLNFKIIKLNYIDVNNIESIKEIIPKKILNYGGKWYLLGYDLKLKELRTFLIARINNIELTENSYNDIEHISDDEVNEFIDGSFGIYKGIETKKAKIKFYGKVANIVEKQIWHKEQQISILEESGSKVVLLEIPYAYHEELIGKVLRYGENAEILEPEELRNIWIDKIKKTYEIFVKN